MLLIARLYIRTLSLCPLRSDRVQNSAPQRAFWLAIGAPRQAHREHRAFAVLARHGHIAYHHVRELAREGKSEPRSAEVLSGCGIGLGELLEQLCLLLRRHANAGIGDGELDPAAAVGDSVHPQSDLARFGELAGIAEEVE